MTSGHMPGPDDPGYEAWHATVQDAIRYDVGGTPALHPGPWEALIRLSQPGVGRLVDLDPFDLSELEAAVEAAVDRGRRGELSTSGAAHAALDNLREAGVPVPARPPDDPFPDR